MNRFALQLLAATTAALVLSTAQASGQTATYEDDGAPVAYTFEENYPASDGPDLALMLDLPVDYFSEVNFPPMSDYTLEDPPVMMAGLDPTETP